jgi:4-amino-4-deoxy-L-arabinose transferase-like glycosyltransferase
MSRWRWLVLLVLGVLTAGSMAVFVRVPGYMDAEYYYATAIQISDGRGFQEPFLWNYLDDPASLPHPSHLYWMPMASVLAAAGLKILGSSFRSAQLPSVILAAGLPVLTAWLSLHLKANSRQAFLAGLLAAFSGFYLPFLVTTDAFAAYAWISTLAFACAAAANRGQRSFLWLAAGLLAGVAQLARADGILLLLPLAVLAVLSPRRRLMAIGLLAAGYAVVIAPWVARNLAASGSPLAAGGTRTLWLTRYDELFTYPPTLLGPARWASQGLAAILAARVEALGSNLATLMVVIGSVVLGPFMLMGAWQKRREPLVAGSAGYLLLLLMVMTVAFPFSGARGGLFHSGAGVLPILWALAPFGIDGVLGWASARRRWNPERARRLFMPAIVAVIAGISIWVAWDRAAAGWPSTSRWEASDSHHRAVTDALFLLDASPGIVAVNDPPGFYLVSGLPCVVVPFGDASTLRVVVDRFNVEWVILDANFPAPLAGVYANPGSVPWLALRGQIDDSQGRPVYLLQVIPSGAGATP